MNDTAITTSGLTKKYGSIIAVNDVTLKIPKGSIFGLIGRNGAGKTTMLKMFAGLAYPTAGSFTIDDTPYNNIVKEKKLKKIGVLIEEPGLNKGFNARDNLKFKALGLGINVNEAHIDELLQFVGLNAAKMRKTKGYSLGMRQRLGIAMALIGDPDILILDEPINGLDPQGIIEMRTLFHNLQAQGKTLIISSHLLSELSRIATHYAFIDHGKIVHEVTSAQLDEYQTSGLYLLKTNKNPQAYELLHALDEKWELSPQGLVYSGEQPDLAKIVEILKQSDISMLSFNAKAPDIEEIFMQYTDNQGEIL